MQLDDFLDRLEGVTAYSGGYKAFCPGHDDTNEPSLGISEADDGTLLVQCYTGCATENVVKAMGLTLADLFPGTKTSWGDPEAVYPYTDEEGNVLFEACRFPGKNFRQRHKDEEGKYVYDLQGVRRVLYRLPAVLAAAREMKTLYLCEGEKDVGAFVARGFEATCNPMGAGKWRKEYTPMLEGANVIIVQDKDDAGIRHAEKVKAILREAGVLVMVVEAKEGKDAYDHFDAGFSVDDFQAVQERARRGIVTAREMAETGAVHLKSIEGSIPEYLVPDFYFGFGKNQHALSLKQGRPYLVGGYTSDGKSTWMLQTVRTLCSAIHPPRVGVFSMEMAADDLRNRLVEHWGIPLWYIEHPWEMDTYQRMRYEAACAQMREWPLEVVFDTQLSAESICDTSRDRDYDVIFVDHIHRFSWGGERRTLEREIAMLTNLSLDFNIPVVLLAQLRSRIQAGGKFEQFPRPTINEFKETSVLGEEAAMALAIWRHRNGATYDPSGRAELIVLKNRYGATGSMDVKLDTRRMIFVPGGTPDVTDPPAAPDQPQPAAY